MTDDRDGGITVPIPFSLLNTQGSSFSNYRDDSGQWTRGEGGSTATGLAFKASHGLLSPFLSACVLRKLSQKVNSPVSPVRAVKKTLPLIFSPNPENCLLCQ